MEKKTLNLTMPQYWVAQENQDALLRKSGGVRLRIFESFVIASSVRRFREVTYCPFYAFSVICTTLAMYQCYVMRARICSRSIHLFDTKVEY